MSNSVFVTGSTGNVGLEVVKHLQVRGCSVIAAVHSNKNRQEVPGVVFREFDFKNPETWDSCLKGVDTVFLVRPPHISKVKRDIFPFLDYLKERGTTRIVFLSVQGAENNEKIPHHKIENRILQLGLTCTFLRPSFFMQNLTTTHLEEIRDEGQLFIPSGDGRTNFIDVGDIGEVAALCLREQSFENRAYTLTGSTSYSYGEVAEYLSRGLGKSIVHTNPGPLKFLFYHIKKGRKAGMAVVMLALYTIVKSGKGDITTQDIRELLGHEPMELEEFIKVNKNLLTGERE